MSYSFGYSENISHVAGRALINQIQTITTQTRLNVTVCLYIRPNNRARSLSTLMAADVRSDTTVTEQTKEEIVCTRNCDIHIPSCEPGKENS